MTVETTHVAPALEQLRDDQLAAFDTEYVNDARWVPVKRAIDRDFPDGRFTFLDLGGGNGTFADRILNEYPLASGGVLDISRLLLSRNRPHPRKELLFASAERVSDAIGERKFDIISANWLLHHLVTPSYSQSRTNIHDMLRSMTRHLTERGRISVYENLYDGLVFDGLPSRMIHRLTSARRLAAMIRRAGANSAGVGVCFLSLREWRRTFAKAALEIASEELDAFWQVPMIRKVFLHIGSVRCGHFWLRSQHN